MKLEGWQSPELKRRYKLVRRDDCTDIEGDIICADEETGEALLNVTTKSGAETRALSLGPLGLRIVRRAR